MGYSLGDDKRSFDVFEETQYIQSQLGNMLVENGWRYNDYEYFFVKDKRILSIELSQDHVTEIYILDDSIDYKKLCNKNNSYEIIYDSDDSIYGVCISVSKNTDVKKIFNDIEYAPLKEKNNDYEL